MKIKYDWSEKETFGLIVKTENREFAVHLTKYGEVAMSDCQDIEKEDSQGWWTGEQYRKRPSDPVAAAVFEMFIERRSNHA